MLNLLNLLNRDDRGFTLVELMVVVVIIGILVAIVIVSYGKIQDGAAMRAHEANLRTIDGAVAMFNAEYGFDPVATMTFDGVDGTEHTIVADEEIKALVAAGFLDKEPEIPERIVSMYAKDNATLAEAVAAGDIYYLAKSTLSNGEIKSFPAPGTKFPKAYRTGDVKQVVTP